MKDNWKKLAFGIRNLLNLQSPPIAITFSDVAPQGISPYEGVMPEPTLDGRTGKVPAGCVFLDKTYGTNFHHSSPGPWKLQCR